MPICLWSGPRNVSTALMYSFAQRHDVQVIDEPLYGHYLRVSGAPHPGRDDVIAAMDCDGEAVMQDLLLLAERSSKRLFLKGMAHHLLELDLTFLLKTTNVFLVRDPREMLPSLTVQLPDATLFDTGLKRQWDLFQDLRLAGQNPTILDSRELLLDPRRVLSTLCDLCELEFDARMLRWNAGPKTEDGVWAPHWYHAVHKSTGFSQYRQKCVFPKRLQSLLDDCKPWYDKLYAYAIRADTGGETS